MSAVFGTTLTKVNDTFFPLIERQLSGNGIQMDGYAKQCVIAALSSIHTAMDTQGITWQDEQLDKSTVTQALLSVACLKLNAAANPREVYFQIRNAKVKGPDGKDVWKKKIEMGIEGDGNDSILARFGRGVKEVRQFWLVREHDEFVYPRYNGLEFEPPKWTPTGKGQIVRVVYPVIKDSGHIEFHISERDDVTRNLLAHIKNNMQSECFGLAESRFKASAAQKKQIDAKKAEILKKAQSQGLAALDDPDLEPWISPAWTEYHSREQMIIRKMRNNVVKKIPKDFGSAFVEMTYADQTDEAEAAVRQEAAANANGEAIDIEAESVEGAPPCDVETGEVQAAPEGNGQGNGQPPAPVQPAPQRAPQPVSAGPRQVALKGPGF